MDKPTHDYEYAVRFTYKGGNVTSYLRVEEEDGTVNISWPDKKTAKAEGKAFMAENPHIEKMRLERISCDSL